MLTWNSKNRSDHATFLVHFERDEKKEAKRRRLKNPSLVLPLDKKALIAKILDVLLLAFKVLMLSLCWRRRMKTKRMP